MAVAVTYCEQADIEDVISIEGLLFRVDDDDDGQAETGLAGRAINKATDRVNLYLSGKYLPADLATSDYITDATSYLATCWICARRGNPVPESLASRCAEIIEELKLIAKGTLNLTDLVQRTNQLPALSNLKWDGRFRAAKVRVQKSISTGGESDLPQNTDLRELGLDHQV